MTRLPSTAKRTCQHAVRVSQTDTVTRRIVTQRRKRLGVASNICGMRAIYLHDDVALCLSHAGQVAIAMVLE